MKPGKMGNSSSAQADSGVADLFVHNNNRAVLRVRGTYFTSLLLTASLQAINGEFEAYDAAEALRGRRVAVLFADGCAFTPTVFLRQWLRRTRLAFIRWSGTSTELCKRLADVYIEAHRKHATKAGLEIPFEVVMVTATPLSFLA